MQNDVVDDPRRVIRPRLFKCPVPRPAVGVVHRVIVGRNQNQPAAHLDADFRDVLERFGVEADEQQGRPRVTNAGVNDLGDSHDPGVENGGIGGAVVSETGHADLPASAALRQVDAVIALIIVFLLAVHSPIEGHGVGAVADFAVFDPIINAAADAIPVLLLDDQPEIHSDADGVDLGVGDVTHPCRRLFQLHIDSCFTFHRREAVDRLLLRGAVSIFQCYARNVN